MGFIKPDINGFISAIDFTALSFGFIGWPLSVGLVKALDECITSTTCSCCLILLTLALVMPSPYGIGAMPTMAIANGSQLLDCNRVFCNVTLSSPCLWASFHPLSPLWMRSAKEGNFIKSGYEQLKLSINAKGSRVVIVSVHLGPSEDICSNKHFLKGFWNFEQVTSIKLKSVHIWQYLNV